MFIHRHHPFEKPKWRRIWISVTMSILLVTLGCGSDRNVRRDTSQAPSPKHLPAMGHTIQVGAFANINNAVRLTQKLQNQGLEAYHFRDSTGLYKVRFGNFPTDNTARLKAESLKAAGIIHAYFLVRPQDYAAADRQFNDNDYLRKEIVNTAKQYIGVNYRWGGQSSGTGFDCSGLTMVVYRLNGLELPRSSRQQWKTGKPVDIRHLSKGDLVFFATTGGRRVSHVGIYIGDNKFLHAPGNGRKIRISLLSNKYFKSRYLGARRYL
jgi:cell wall-associated NlpC family hydrolase